MQGGKPHKSLTEGGSQQIKILSREIMKTLLLLTAMCCVCFALPSQKLQQRKKKAITGTQDCGGLLTDPQGMITSPNFLSAYPNNAHCVWKISTGSAIKISFINFDLEGYMFNCGFDKLQIHDGDRELELCGQMLPLDFTSTQSNVEIVFITDDSVARTGFRFTYAPASNSGSTNSDGRTTTTTPAPQTRRTRTTRKRHLLLSQILQPLPITARTTPTTTKVSTKTTTTRRTTKVSTTTTKPTTTTTPTTTRTTKVSTTKTTTKPTTTRTTTTTTMSTPAVIRFTDCGGLLTNPEEMITSPNFGSSYPNNAYCQWTISSDSPIKISFINFDIEGYMFSCSFDKLQIYDGERELELCGQMLPLDFISTQNTVRIVFITDDSVSRTGFRFTFAPV